MKKPAARPDLTTGAIGPKLLMFAVPTLFSSILQSLNGSINSIWVGRYLGPEALAATTNANLIMFLTMSFVFGFGMAGTILVGQAYGRRDLDQVRKVIGTVVGAFSVLSFVLAAAGWIFAPQLLHLMGLAPEAMASALAYLRVIFIAIPTGMVMVIFTMSLRGTGDALTPLWFMIVSTVIDCGLNPFLIAGIGPFPRMGISGAATATVIANFTSLIALMSYIYIRDLPVRLRGAELRYLRPDPALLTQILKMGLPMGLQMIVLSVASLAMLGLVNREGVETTAAFGVAMQLWTYIQMPAMALSAAVSAMAAQNIGAGRWDRIGKITSSGVTFNLIITGSLVALLALVDRPALALFLGNDSPALPIAQHLQLLVTWSFVMAGVAMTLFGTMRANGAVWGPLIILTVTQLPLRLGLALALHPSMGADGLWIAYPVSSTVSMLLAVAYYRQGSWKKRRIGMPPAKPEVAAEEAMAAGEPEGKAAPVG
jgi:putative MATE family efflux protein